MVHGDLAGDVGCTNGEQCGRAQDRPTPPQKLGYERARHVGEHARALPTNLFAFGGGRPGQNRGHERDDDDVRDHHTKAGCDSKVTQHHRLGDHERAKANGRRGGGEHASYGDRAHRAAPGGTAVRIVIGVHLVAVALDQVRRVTDANDNQQRHDDIVEDVHRLAEEPHSADGHHCRDGDCPQRKEDTRHPTERQGQQNQTNQNRQRNQPKIVCAHFADDDAAEVGQAAHVKLDVLEFRPIQPLAEVVHRAAHLAWVELMELKGDARYRVVLVDQSAHQKRVPGDRIGKLHRFRFRDLRALDDRVGLELSGQRGAHFGDAVREPLGIAFDDVEEGVEGLVLEIALGVHLLLFV